MLDKENLDRARVGKVCLLPASISCARASSGVLRRAQRSLHVPSFSPYTSTCSQLSVSDFPSMPRREARATSQRQQRKARQPQQPPQERPQADAQPVASSSSAGGMLWAHIVRNGKDGEPPRANHSEDAATPALPRPTVTRVDEVTPQSVTQPLRDGISAVALQTPDGGVWTAARLPLQPQPTESDASIGSTPRRVVTAADILRAGGGVAATPAATGHSAAPEAVQSESVTASVATGPAVADPPPPPPEVLPTDPPSQPMPLEKLPLPPPMSSPRSEVSQRSEPAAVPPSQPSRQPKVTSVEAAAVEAASPAKRSGERLSPPRAGAAGGRSVSQLQLPGRHKKQATGNARQLRFMPREVPPCHFEDGTPLQLPPRSALATIDRSLAAFLRHTLKASHDVDGPACFMMEAVQVEVGRLWPGAVVSCFGSRATGLACASSDVDLVVMGMQGLPISGSSMAAQLSWLEQLQPRLAALPGIVSASINRGSVPIIAMTASLPGGTTEPIELHLDISLHTEQHGGLQAAQHVHELRRRLPVLQPIVLLLKKLLYRHSLKSAFTGGLSSYALVVLVSRFLLDRRLMAYPTQHAAGQPPEPEGAASLAELFLECVHFLGSVFDPKQHAVHQPRQPLKAQYATGKHLFDYGFVHREGHDLEPCALHPLHCTDPIRHDNNIGKTCYRFVQIQALFADTASRLRTAAQASAVGEKPMEEGAVEMNLLDELFGAPAC